MDAEKINAKPMELCEEMRCTAPSKRKADSSPLDSSDEGEKEGGDGEESDASSREEGQEWDVDSFDDGFDYRPKRNLDPSDEAGQKMHRYRSQMYRTKGFEVDSGSYPGGNVAYRPLFPMDLDEPFMRTGLTGRQYMESMVDLALQRYNRVKGSSVTCESVVRTIIALVSGLKCYITFMARESPDGDVVEYQAKTEKRIYQMNTHVIFCRPTPEPKEPKEVEYSDSSSDEEDSNVSSRESGQEWDVDSLDEDYQTPKTNAPSDDEIEKMRQYRPQMHKSKGFCVDGEGYSGSIRYFEQINLDEILRHSRITGREYMEKMVKLALEKYNEMKGSNVTLESVVRANLSRVDGYKSYITFRAIEVPGGDPVEYQAKTERKFWQSKTRAILCRPAPKSKAL